MMPNAFQQRIDPVFIRRCGRIGHRIRELEFIRQFLQRLRVDRIVDGGAKRLRLGTKPFHIHGSGGRIFFDLSDCGSGDILPDQDEEPAELEETEGSQENGKKIDEGKQVRVADDEGGPGSDAGEGW